jgi:cell division septation protein DedD
MVNKQLVFIMTKSYFNISKFKISLGVIAACCSLACCSCTIRGYETEEIVEEILDTQKAASTQKFVPSTEKYDASTEEYTASTEKYNASTEKYDASIEKYDASIEKHDATTENLYEKDIKVGSSEVQPTIERGPFTIQIGAFHKEYHAVNLLNSARQTLNTDIYYEFINSQYKVRLGEFPTKADAMGTLEKLWNLGFYGAFIAKK